MDRNDTVQVKIVKMHAVALRKESVDRNARPLDLSWAVSVALRKESVDRNFIELLPWGGWGRRSPQGERG